MANVFPSNIQLNLASSYSATVPVTTFSMDSTAPSVPFTPVSSLGSLGANFDLESLAYNPNESSLPAAPFAPPAPPAPPSTRPYIWKYQ